MTFGERAALEGILSQLKPDLSIEIGTAEGGSLRRIAAHSAHVHSFDLVQPAEEVRALPNVTLHTGDSHVLLAEFLTELERSGTNVDFALVDGDHTAEGVRQDLESLLSSGALRQCVILIHDTANEIVREGLQRVRYGDHRNVTHLDLDFIAGHISDGGPFHHQLWGGLGLVVVDDAPAADGGPEGAGFYSSFEVFSAVRDALVSAEQQGRKSTAREVVGAARATVRDGGASERERQLSAELAGTQAILHSVTSSVSWRATAPLRSVKQAIESRRRA